MTDIFIDIRNENEWIKKYFKKDLVNIDDMLSVIESLDSDVERLKEDLEDLRQEIKDNYRPISYAEQVGVFNEDFH